VPVTERDPEVSLPPEAEIEPPSGRIAWYRVAIPIAGVLAGLAALWSLDPSLRTRSYSFLGMYMLPGGIDYGIPIAVGALDLAPHWVVGLVTYFDLWITLFWVWNVDHLSRFDVVDERVAKSRARAHRLFERFPRLRVATAPGLAAFILLPIPWTGSFAGIVVGKLIGLNDLEVYLASILGTLGRVLLLAYGSAGVLSFL
jgi:uncharacterized membrane protein